MTPESKLRLEWLKATCCALLPGGQPNPAFNAGVRVRLRRGFDHLDDGDTALFGLLVQAGWRTDEPEARVPYQIVAGLFAWHPKPSTDRASSFGHVCRRLALQKQLESNRRGVDPDKNTFTPRFERLLSCRRPDQMAQPLRGIVRMLATSEDPITIHFQRLLIDLLRWERAWRGGNGPRQMWARDYWWQPRDPKEDGSADDNGPPP